MNLSLEDWSWARQKRASSPTSADATNRFFAVGVGYDISDQLDPWELSSYLRDHMPSAFFDEMISDEVRPLRTLGSRADRTMSS